MTNVRILMSDDEAVIFERARNERHVVVPWNHLSSNELPLIVYSALAVLVTATMLASYVLGERHRDPGAGTPYESCRQDHEA